MKSILAMIFLLVCFEVSAQQDLGLTGKQFFALSVSSTDSVSAWYENVFNLKLLKELKSPDRVVDVRIVGNENLTIEILSHKAAKSLADCGISSDQPFGMRGIFKIGLYVKDVVKAQDYLEKKNVSIKNKIFEDRETQTKSFVIRDSKQNLIQFIQHL
jgi:hypothetical protein